MNTLFQAISSLTALLFCIFIGIAIYQKISKRILVQNAGWIALALFVFSGLIGLVANADKNYSSVNNRSETSKYTPQNNSVVIRTTDIGKGGHILIASDIIGKTKSQIKAIMGKPDSHSDLGYEYGIRYEEYSYKSKFSDVKKLVVFFRNGISNKIVAYFYGDKYLNWEDCFKVMGIAYDMGETMIKADDNGRTQFARWIPYFNYKKIEIMYERNSEGKRMPVYISAEL